VVKKKSEKVRANPYKSELSVQRKIIREHPSYPWFQKRIALSQQTKRYD